MVNNYFMVTTPSGTIHTCFDDRLEASIRDAYAHATSQYNSGDGAMSFRPRMAIWRPLPTYLARTMGIVARCGAVEYGPDPEVARSMCFRCKRCGVRQAVKAVPHMDMERAVDEFEERHAPCEAAFRHAEEMKRIRDAKQSEN